MSDYISLQSSNDWRTYISQSARPTSKLVVVQPQNLQEKNAKFATSIQRKPFWCPHRAPKSLWAGALPRTPLGSSRRSPRLPSWVRRGHPSSYPTPLDIDAPLALVIRAPRITARSTPRPMCTAGVFWANGAPSSMLCYGVMTKLKSWICRPL